MSARLDLTGMRFHRLVAIERAESRNGQSRWLCRCDCGAQSVVRLGNLRSGAVRSCGCSRPEGVREANSTHGHCSGGCSRTYQSWRAMRERCTYRNFWQWKNYGGRGITVCDRWLNSFENFLSDMGERPKGLTLDRIDNDGNYEPNNCRWATYTQQARNKRSTRRMDQVACGMRFGE